MKRTRANQQSTAKTILTNDPSLTAWGWAIVDWNGVIVAAGCLKTVPENKKQRIRKGDDNVRRVNEISLALVKIIKKYNVNYIVTELPHGSQNAAAATMIGIVLGILETISVTMDIGIEWYMEADSKKAVLGKTASTKQEMIKAISKLFPDTPWKGVGFRDEAIADAMAIYYVARQQSSTLKLLNQNGQ